MKKLISILLIGCLLASVAITFAADPIYRLRSYTYTVSYDNATNTYTDNNTTKTLVDGFSKVAFAVKLTADNATLPYVVAQVQGSIDGSNWHTLGTYTGDNSTEFSGLIFPLQDNGTISYIRAGFSTYTTAVPTTAGTNSTGTIKMMISH